MSDLGWLADIAHADEIDLNEAAALLIENGITLSAADWRELSTKERAAITVARRLAQGRDLDVARDAGDGGRTWARLAARAAGKGVADALAKKKAGQ